MFRIDLLGPPGVGKTTLYNQLSAHLVSTLSAEQTYLKAAPFAAKQLPNHKLRVVAYSIIFKLMKQSRWAKLLARRLALDYATKRLLVNSSTELDKFIHVALTLSLQNTSHPTKAILGVAELVDSIKEFVLFKELFPNISILSDESICHKVFSLVDFHSLDVEQQIKSYFYSAPLPSLLLYFTISEKLHEERITIRESSGTIRPEHMSEYRNEILKRQRKAVSIGVDIMTERGVCCIKIDSDRSSVEMLDKVIEVLKHNAHL